MSPAFKPGDHILTFNWVTPKEGEVIAFLVDDRFYLKRIKIANDLIHVEGDNKKSSMVAPIKRKQIIGKIILKY